ncbi:LexA family transcriptional regulator [Piscirickettsia salmonis]|uniref:LexA family transcriptional regulator n=1 Tax=Piscirickettsia salmonis TaxID=1238 RepID=UPI0003059CCF|nr:LexA family transcriptional regulator [Piscirickettsia salmonis]APS58081.1 hypothetical protein AVI52_13070 [Piscirickettsia salmonis]ERL61161.1 helix-turn-helix family protein [Piscirickettsia salmonis LF-89 = ATCC VR-1361]PEQ15252.1 hypothetical protein X973_13740 [Piscirickettsia salmonis]QGN76380.1 putative HTH-type transcriptional regulator [Piscirickettsia salmonis]QGN79970.1 putative HTH-type transcriptional regulator [Piscirickettsia salmonis]
MMSSNNLLIKNIKMILEYRGLTQAYLYKNSNVPQSVINKILSGETPNPRVSTVLEIAACLGIKVGDLFTEISIDSLDKTVKIPMYNIDDITSIKKEKPIRYVWSNAKNVTNKCFATEQKDSSMSPIIPIDSLLIIDPSKEARDGDYILLLVGKNILLRRYLDAGDTKYYELLNPKFDGIKKEMTKKNRILVVTISVELKL